VVRGSRRHVADGIEQEHAELDRGQAVDHAVVRLSDQREAVTLDVVGDPHLPQCPIARQRARHHTVGHLAHIGGLCGQDMVLDAEVGIVDPERVVHRPRDGDQALAIAWRDPQAAGDVLLQRRKGRGTPARSAPELGDPADVHVRSGALDLEERRVERR
jgi:hypothetical protein